jgi:hypothetical protein
MDTTMLIDQVAALAVAKIAAQAITELGSIVEDANLDEQYRIGVIVGLAIGEAFAHGQATARDQMRQFSFSLN